MSLIGKSVLLIISGGIAAYKTLELIRRLRERHVQVTPVMTTAAAQFVTPLSVAALAGEKVYTDLFDLTDETEMGHIQLSRRADLIVVAPASADILARMAQGRADDLAATLLLATDTPVLVAPAMNVRMWQHPATRRNVAQLQQDGVTIIGPDDGDMACGEFGPGRLKEVPELLTAIEQALSTTKDKLQDLAASHDVMPTRPLAGRTAVVTSGPTREPLDPVRYLSNHSSGKQGHAIAQALATRGATVRLISGPVHIPDPIGVKTTRVETAEDMYRAVHAALPADIVICAAAVADWRAAQPGAQKWKKSTESTQPALSLVENPDILASVAQMTDGRPQLVIGFSAETENIVDHAQTKRRRKECDWILANDVSPDADVFGGDANTIHFISETQQEQWPHQSKTDVAEMLVARITSTLQETVKGR